jgi:hypothetical protein
VARDPHGLEPAAVHLVGERRQPLQDGEVLRRLGDLGGRGGEAALDAPVVARVILRLRERRLRLALGLPAGFVPARPAQQERGDRAAAIRPDAVEACPVLVPEGVQEGLELVEPALTGEVVRKELVECARVLHEALPQELDPLAPLVVLVPR